MSCLPFHGKINCTLCHTGKAVEFNRTLTYSDDGNWRLTANPLAWGSQRPVVVVLGFSKGSSAMAALANPRSRIEDIPYATKRSWVARLLHSVGLLPGSDQKHVEKQIADKGGLYHFGSLVRCTVEQKIVENGNETWITKGNGMLENFSSHPFGQEVVSRCTTNFLGSLPASVKVIVLFGLGRNLERKDSGRNRFSYVENVKKTLERTFGRPMQMLNDLAYYNDKITVVHIEHFAEPSYATRWLSKDHERRFLRHQAAEAVQFAISR